MSYVPRIIEILEDDRFTAIQNVTIAIKYAKRIIEELEQTSGDLKKAEEQKTTKDFYKFHLHVLIERLLGESG